MRLRSMAMTWLSFSSTILLLALAASAQRQQEPSNREKPQTGAVSGSGCVERGVELGCLVLNDLEQGKTYNLFFRTEKKPRPGGAISFTGFRHDGPTACMQGMPVNVTKWAPAKMKCPKRDD